MQLQQMDQEYRALLADLEEHAVSECKAARQLAKAAEALALVAVVDGEGEGDWGVWSGLGSSLLAQSHLRLALCKTQAVAPAAEVRQRHLWEEGGALHTPAVALITAVRDLVDGVLARAVASRTQYRDTLAEASTQVPRQQNMHLLFFSVFSFADIFLYNVRLRSHGYKTCIYHIVYLFFDTFIIYHFGAQVARLQNMQELLARASAANRDAQLQHVQTQRIQVRALNHKLGMDRVELVRRYARVQPKP